MKEKEENQLVYGLGGLGHKFNVSWMVPTNDATMAGAPIMLPRRAVAAQFTHRRSALPKQEASYLVRPQAICAPAFIDPAKVARRARLV